MKITDIGTIPLAARAAPLVQIKTDPGLVGLGAAGVAGGPPNRYRVRRTRRG
jgi:L-alanine-DL-glutamate epimerase-like enolase superfamily enzyme